MPGNKATNKGKQPTKSQPKSGGCCPSCKTILSIFVPVIAVLYLWARNSPAGQSFPITNYGKHQGFKVEDIPDMTGKIVIVTGGNTGLGKETVLQLAKKNAHVVLACRTPSKGEAAKQECQSKGATGKIDVMQLDLNSLASVRAFAKNFLAKFQRLDVLVLNAGIMATPFGLTKDGIESQFGVNHVAHHLLTMELLPILKKSEPSRIVIVSSRAHYLAPSHGVGLDLAAINNEQAYNLWTAYGQSKLANVFFGQELASKLWDTKVYVNIAHPGFVKTELLRYSFDDAGALKTSLLQAVQNTLAYTVEDGAVTQLYLAASPEIESKNIRGRYFVPQAVETQPSVTAHDTSMQKGLWAFTEKLIAEKSA
eukprot:TRINITY_DN45978_c0_g1_i1.p1 TRINITY_DN45978_c0_g1~~TRINITY_DN45978_c0_g1_i1.p1  ORF type:complete len:367 (+),score=24.97 TRINITY_DN45978_c0_g1_i1:39-1139(+)